MPQVPRSRIVIDTNIYISQVLNHRSTPSLAVLKAERSGEILISTAILNEISEVLRRRKFDRYVSLAVREAAIDRICSIATPVEPSAVIRVCRNPKDDKFLELAVHGQADVIVTGDRDLLDLNPFRGIAILTPAEYVEWEQS